MKIKMQDTEFKQQNVIQDTMRINSALRDRKIYLSDEVSRETMFEAMYFMDRIKAIDEMEGLDINKRDPIEIIINSYGGSCYDGISLVSKVLSFKNMGYTIITTVTGVAMSMGFVIALVASHRQSYRYARFMCHQPSSATFGTLKDMRDDIEETMYIWNVMKDIIVEHTDITHEMLDTIYREKTDKYYSPEQALKLKIIDKII